MYDKNSRRKARIPGMLSPYILLLREALRVVQEVLEMLE